MITKKKGKPKHLGRGLASLIGPITNTDIDSRDSIPFKAATHNYPIDKELQESLKEENLFYPGLAKYSVDSF